VSGGDDGDRSAFDRAMKGVKRLAGDRTPRRPQRPKPGPKPERARTRFVADGAGEEAGFYATDVGPELLRKLLRGELAPLRTIDLHGLTEEGARHAVERGIADALAAGVRGLRLVHGRGLHSPGGPVLREALRGWLEQPAVARSVAGFARAPARAGGAGATLVCLRPPRKAARS
jgi:DNA-nicking Smr family endonuclease